MTNQNQNDDSQSGDQSWTPCNQGAISGLVRRLKQQRQRQQLTKVALTASCVLLGLFLGNQFWFSPTSLSHDQVSKLAESFINGDLDAETTKLVEAHIAVCPRCEHLLEDRAVRQSQARLIMPDDSVVMIEWPTDTLVASSR